MNTWKPKDKSLWQLSKRELKEQEILSPKKYPTIKINEEISKTIRPCNTATFSSVYTREFEENQQNNLELLYRRIIPAYNRLRNSYVISKLIGAYEKLQRIFLQKKISLENISDYVETKTWSTSFIRFMAWHPHVFMLAIACADDIVRVYSESGINIRKMKNKSQKCITCLAWRPFAIDEIAIGCAEGIAFWFSHTPNDQSLYMRMLTHSDHFPITALDWRADGLLLASGSINDPNILLWNVDTGCKTPLKCVRSVGQCFLKWTPSKPNLFTVTMKGDFRMWNVESSNEGERWKLKSGRIQSAAWSPCGEILLFVASDDTKVYRFQKTVDSVFLQAEKRWRVIPIFDLVHVFIGESVIGGLPQSIVWDPSGSFVAINFKDTNSVAVCRTTIVDGSLVVVPLGYIAGPNDEHSVSICFQSLNLLNKEVVLTIGWSNGIVQFCSLQSFLI